MDDINSTILLVGGSLIGVVVLHGLWVAWRSRKEPLRFDLAEMSDTGEDHDELALLRGELPNGGARVVGTTDEVEDRLKVAPRLDAVEPDEQALDAPVVESAVDAPVDPPVVAQADVSVDERADERADAPADEPLDETVDETVDEVEDEIEVPERVADEPAIVTDEAFEEVVFDTDGRVEPVLGRFEIEPQEDVGDSAESSDDETLDEQPAFAAQSAAQEDTAVPAAFVPDEFEPVEPPTQTSLDIDSKVPQEITLTPERSRRLRFNFGATRKSARGDKAEPAKKGRIERDFIAMWVTARHGGKLGGGEIIEALSRNSMRYTPSKVFCRLDPEDGTEQFQFVNGIEPGTFDITTIEELETPRVLFLLTLPGPANPIAALEDMVEVARDVAMALGADLLDDRRSAISGQTIEHYRNRISDFTRRSLSRRSETQ